MDRCRTQEAREEKAPGWAHPLCRGLEGSSTIHRGSHSGRGTTRHDISLELGDKEKERLLPAGRPESQRSEEHKDMESRVLSAPNCASTGAWGTEMGSTSSCGGKASGRRRKCSCWALKGRCVAHAGGRYSSKGNWEWGRGEGGKDKEM